MRKRKPNQTVAEMRAKREAVLPQWAQHELSRLRANIVRLEAHVRSVLGEDPSSEIEVNQTYGDKPRTFLPEFSRVTYHFGKHTSIEVSFKDEGVEFMANGGYLGIQPHAANVAHAFVIEH